MAVSDSTLAPGRSETISISWLALVSGFLGWMFDAMDLNVFTLVLFPSVAQLTGSTNGAEIAQVGGYIMAAKLFCWGIGGIVFGVVADRIGRTRTMVITILMYSVFTGLSGLAQSWTQLAILQAFAGFGIGGEWAAGTALIAETWPEKSRARAMQVVQMAFAFGFLLAALDNLLLGPVSWRWVLAAGALPAVITLGVRSFVPEPQRWLRVRKDPAVAAMTASRTFSTLFSPELRRGTIIGVLVSSAMMIGSWGGLTLLPSWIQQLVRASGGGPAAGTQAVSQAFMLMMAGAVLGYLTLVFLCDVIGRRWSYFLFVSGSLMVSAWVFTQVTDLPTLIWWMPLFGYFVIGGFGTFAAYLPELFPTRVRASGQGFCWNAARCATAIGPMAGGVLVGTFGSFPAAALSTAVFYVVGMVAIWFGPETKGVPLRD